MIIEITHCVGTQGRGEDIEFDVLDVNGMPHTLRISAATFGKMVVDAMLARAITKDALEIELSGAATYLTSGARR